MTKAPAPPPRAPPGLPCSSLARVCGDAHHVGSMLSSLALTVWTVRMASLDDSSLHERAHVPPKAAASVARKTTMPSLAIVPCWAL